MLDETGLVEDYQIEGTSPMFGINDRGVDQSATSVGGAVSTKVARPPGHRNEHHTRNLPNRSIFTGAVEHSEIYPALTSSSRDTRRMSSGARADVDST